MRDKIAQSILESGDQLWLLEHTKDDRVQLWMVKDHESYNDPYGRLPIYQVWNGDKRCYVGTNQAEAYNDYGKQVREVA